MNKTTFEKSCDEIDDFISNWSDSEKKFALWKLLRYYQEGLREDIKFIPKDEYDYLMQKAMKHQILVCDEIAHKISKEIF